MSLVSIFFAAAALLVSFDVHAHGTVAGTTTFVAGLLHPLTALEHVLPLIALGMLAGQRGLRAGEALLVAFPVAFASGTLAGSAITALPELASVNAFTGLVVGCLVALALALPRTLLYVLVGTIGAIHGLSNGAAGEQVVPAFIAGATLASTLVFAYAFALTDRALRRTTQWIPVAVRTLGSWIAAFGILTLALSLTSTQAVT